MILDITISGTVNSIDTKIVLYGYDDSGLKLAISTSGIKYSPSAEIFQSTSLNTVTLPTYADFVTDTASFGFLEVTHGTYTNVCINLARIEKLEAIDSSNTTVRFDKYNSVNVNMSLSALETAINSALTPSSGGVTDGDKGDVTVSSSGSVWTIDNLAVTNAKINDVDATKVNTDSTHRFVTDAQLTVIGNTSGTNSGNETTGTIGTLINWAGSATPNDTDLVATAESSTLKKITWTNVKAFLKTYFDTIYTTTSAVATQISTALSSYLTTASASATYQTLANKDATGGYAGLTLFKINFKNALNTFTSFFTNANTASRTYTFQDRDGTIADNTDLALKAPLISPSFTTPSLGVASATSLNTGSTLNGTIFAKSTTALTLASTAHAETVGNESSGVNGAIGLYSTGIGLQGRNNGATAVTNINPLGGDVRFGIDAPSGVFNITGFHTGGGTGDYCNLELRNGAGVSAVDALFMRIMGTAWTTAGMNIQDAGVIGTGTNISGGLSIGTQASADIRVYTNNTLRWTLDSAGDLSTTGKLRSSGGGLGYATGAGGTVTQITSRTTGVTLNKLCGNITMFSAAQAANALVTFTLTNSFIEATDFLAVQHISATNGGAWNISVVCSAGSATINIRNVSTGSITEATPLRFFLNKAVTS